MQLSLHLMVLWLFCPASVRRPRVPCLSSFFVLGAAFSGILANTVSKDKLTGDLPSIVLGA